MTRLNGKHPMPTLMEFHHYKRQCEALEERLRALYRSKCELEETLAEERQIYANDREIWRMGKLDIPLTASDSGCLHTAGGET